MEIVTLRNKKIIEAHLRKNTELNLYQLGDLDDFFFKFTQWYGIKSEGSIKQVVLIYNGTDLPVLLALCDKDSDEMKFLLKGILNKLPGKFYSHISEQLKDVIEECYDYKYHGKYLKMILDRKDFRTPKEDKNIRRLNSSDTEDVLNLYKHSYPENWFDRRMLETGKYFGYFKNRKLIGISGIHVYSSKYKIAVLGNITTDPDQRGKSICAKITSALCEDLFLTVDHIGLNVNENNIAAIKSYEKTGFRIRYEYDEYMFEKKLQF